MKTKRVSTPKRTIRSLDKNTTWFIGDLVKKCHQKGVTLHLKASERVNVGRIKCNGSFDEDKIEVATKNKFEFWLGILVHESCHMDQWANKTRIWKEIDPYLRAVDKWLNSKDHKLKSVKKAFSKVIELELDCEKRSIKKIEKYKLPIDKEEYIKGANAYLLSYTFARKNRKWYKYPYKNPRIRRAMPTKLLNMKDFNNLDHPLLQYYTPIKKKNVK
jgi:hypothetical protein